MIFLYKPAYLSRILYWYQKFALKTQRRGIKSDSLELIKMVINGISKHFFYLDTNAALKTFFPSRCNPLKSI